MQKELYKLHPHQKEAFDGLKNSFRRGNKRPLLYASVAFGKTVLAAHVVAGGLDKGNRVCFVVPFTVLINQTAKSFMDQGLPQPGIIQADHPWTDPSKRLQIASVQTLSRRKVDDIDLYIVDEAHVIYKEIVRISEETRIPFVGLSGSPFTKGLGKIYDDLIMTKTMSQLIDEGFLSKYIAYAPCKPDMTGVKTSMGDFQQKQTGEKMSDSVITGSITEQWLKLGENEQTICFAVNVAHAQHLGKEFSRIGISNAVITARTPHDERERIFKLFEDKAIKILINVGTLTTGMDKDVRCIIFARPTKSKILWVQMCGRGLRTAEGKEKAIFLDHAGNFERLGYPEDCYIYELDDGKKNEAAKKKDKQEKKEKLPKVCPNTDCNYLKPVGEHQCSRCGFMPVFSEGVETEEGELELIKGKPKKADKQAFWSELMGYKQLLRKQGKNYSDGYYSHKYKEKFGVWPRQLEDTPIKPSESTLGWIKAKQIAFAKSKEKR